jgi:DNA transformation protein
MATKQSTIDFLLEQIDRAGSVRARKMFGEYALYCNEKVVALVCDDKLYIKPTKAGKEFIGTIEEAPPYPGAKMYYHISGDYWEDPEWLTELITKTAQELPLPKMKKSK